MNYILFDGNNRNTLLPFTFTRPVADIRVGILTLREKWEKHLNSATSIETQEYLSGKYPQHTLDKNIKIDPSFLPTDNLVGIVKNLKENQAVFYDDTPIAYFYNKGQTIDFDAFDIISYTHNDLIRIAHTWDIFKHNADAIALDFALLTK